MAAPSFRRLSTIRRETALQQFVPAPSSPAWNRGAPARMELCFIQRPWNFLFQHSCDANH
jgi:hypothetical protein